MAPICSSNVENAGIPVSPGGAEGNGVAVSVLIMGIVPATNAGKDVAKNVLITGVGVVVSKGGMAATVGMDAKNVVEAITFIMGPGVAIAARRLGTRGVVVTSGIAVVVNKAGCCVVATIGVAVVVNTIGCCVVATIGVAVVVNTIGC